MEKENLCVSLKGDFQQHAETRQHTEISDRNRNIPTKGKNVPESGT